MALTADEDITTNQVTEEEKKPDEGEVSEERYILTVTEE